MNDENYKDISNLTDSKANDIQKSVDISKPKSQKDKKTIPEWTEENLWITVILTGSFFIYLRIKEENIENCITYTSTAVLLFLVISMTINLIKNTINFAALPLLTLISIKGVFMLIRDRLIAFKNRIERKKRLKQIRKKEIENMMRSLDKKGLSIRGIPNDKTKI